ncbi:hypothetical protein SAMN04489720_3208 [Agrococcus jejuensis]|uniref:Uncharacterized protein n=2 Tax=Agrococcus jejuensis TaxID=399736 RepID=A0A1G8H4A4_9MICO|nr:hypothetical protein SAMN04489720_3208 [Agrococcus jejuensis]
MMHLMDDATHRMAIDAARARFDAGEHRAAWDLLGARARAHPTVPAYREALADLHRRVDHPDQVGRWGAHDVDRLTDRERRALRRSLVGFRSEAAVRDYLVLDGELPTIVRDHLADVGEQEVEDRIEGTKFAGHTVAALGALTLAVGLGTVGYRAFIGADDVQRVAQTYACFLLGEVILAGLAYATFACLRRRWVLCGLIAVVVVAAIVLLGRADLTAPIPFG